ncbi:MAG: flippase [Bacteroidetes bacterium]|nr:flippase [Bacteroidota bacterium]MBT5527834.1 flippase [Cytophagia bacterium]MBT3421773.1 flippase [Bacteroidota bacterium]MBT3800811.1 flippase [Bacteroidota bacterium]MBT3933284.1 flippase [Bacteroidota bacterium]
MKTPDFISKDLNLKEIFKGGSVAFVFKIAGILMGYIFFLIIAKEYKAEKLGVFSLCWTMLMFGAVLGRLGLDTAIVRFIASDISTDKGQNTRNIHRKGLALVLISSIFFGLLFFVFSKHISLLFFDDNSNYNLIRIVGMAIIPLSVMTYNAESLRGLKRIGLFSIFQNGSIYILVLLILVSVSFFKHDLHFLIQSVLFSIIIMAVFSLFLYRKEENKIEQIHSQNSKPINSILKVAIPMLLTNSLFLVMNWTDILMIGAFRAETEVGVYSIAVKIAALNSIVLAAVNSIAAPKFAELFSKNNKSGLRRIAKQTTLINTLLSLPIFLVIVIFPGFLMRLFGAEFETGVSALIILACGQIFNALSGSKMYILNMTNHEKTGQNIILFGAIINVILNALLIPKYGLTGGAIATLSSTVIWNVLGVYYIHKYHGFLTYPINIRNEHAN